MSPRARLTLTAAALALAACTLLAAGPVAAEPEFSTLVADAVEITPEGSLAATGNVEAIYGDTRLTARRIVYNQDNDTLQIEGPMVLTRGGSTVLLADGADLSTDLRDGLIRSARMVMNQKMQVAAAEVDRVGGRYTQFYNTVASSCQVCVKRPVPLWQIRARRVVHDEIEHQLYFDQARFEVMGVPVAWFPQLRMPDPSLKRATGFLAPKLVYSTEVGSGIKVPYFITLGDNRDLTITPYLAADYTATVELRYRQAFRRGDIEFNGALTEDSILPGETRGYLFGDGDFDLPNDFRLEFQVQTVTDKTYLQDYDISDKDRLTSSVTLSRVRRDRLFEAELLHYYSLREDDSNETDPFLEGDVLWLDQFHPALVGGTFTTDLVGHMHLRHSDQDIVGRNVGRVSGHVGWERAWTLPAGLRFTGEGHAFVDYETVAKDSTYPDPITDVTPYGVVELSWPWMRQGGRGAQTITPIAQLVWAPDEGEQGPNDQSTQVNFDQGNLFSLSRFPAGDERERGLRANLGVNWTRFDPAGWQASVTMGRIVRQEDLGQFAGFQPLEGTISDWMTAVSFTLPSGLKLMNLAYFDQNLDPVGHEAQFNWSIQHMNLGATYIWFEPNTVPNQTEVANEWTLNGNWNFSDRWSTRVNWNYDIELDRSASARWGLTYTTDCASFDLSMRRRYTSNYELDPVYDYTFGIVLAGFGGPESERAWPGRMGCRG